MKTPTPGEIKELELVTLISIEGDKMARALNTFGMPYARLLAART